MDYPKSIPSVGLVNGRFVDENPVTGSPGSLIPAVWGNAVTQEILSVVAGAGMAPSEADNGQLFKAIQTIIGMTSPMRSVVTRLAASKVLAPEELGLVLIDGSPAATTITLPPADVALGVRDVIVRRVDNSGNRLVIRAAGSDRIRFHTHLSASGYPFLVLMGGGDWWQLRSDGAGSWWPVGRFDNTPLGRPFFETTLQMSPGGYGALNGNVLSRSDWPWLWDHAQQSGALTTEAARGGMEGGWTSADGALNFRIPEARGEFLRVLDESRGVDVARTSGSSQVHTLQKHNHFLPTGTGSSIRPASSIPDGLWDVAHDVNAVPTNTTVATTYPNPAFDAGTEGGVGNIGTFSAETRPRNIAYPGRIKLI
ncbi:phage tail protein [Pseudomonas frederiksbergensis]|uniref:phage tail protein n=1 Tax=Pseudomonas frederiksbergensis TaxID=104087 RepID=UPI000F47F935|nr:phage tail protein [Pseudomonas frederiksbergensis]RON56982.1 phage tail protein [Pseudomonas frederiksbergensis]